MDSEWRDWLRSLGAPPADGADVDTDLSPEATDHLVQITVDGTLKDALDQIGASEPDLAG